MARTRRCHTVRVRIGACVLARGAAVAVSREEAMRVYTIYFDPLDYPGAYVVRGSTVTEGKVSHDRSVQGVADSLEAARELVPKGFDTLFPRQPSDEPQIVECWI